MLIHVRIYTYCVLKRDTRYMNLHSIYQSNSLLCLKRSPTWSIVATKGNATNNEPCGNRSCTTTNAGRDLTQPNHWDFQTNCIYLSYLQKILKKNQFLLSKQWCLYAKMYYHSIHVYLLTTKLWLFVTFIVIFSQKLSTIIRLCQAMCLVSIAFDCNFISVCLYVKHQHLRKKA